MIAPKLPILKTIDDNDFARALLAIDDQATKQGDLRAAAALKTISTAPLFLAALRFVARLEQNDSIVFAEHKKTEVGQAWSTN